MQEAVPAGRGAIAAILGLEQERVVEVCLRAGQGEVVTGVNFNAPGQVVVAGHVGAVERALGLAREAGAKRAVRLPMSVPAHCPLMEAVAERFSERLSRVALRAPQVPVIHNVDVACHQGVEELRSVLARQLYSPVRWCETVAAMGARGVKVVVECGPGKVLAALARRIDAQLTALPIFNTASLDKTLEHFGPETEMQQAV
jgi:[acyl-carrier-protein] S-malonyltransferase